MTTPAFTFDSSFPDGSPRRYAGMSRPPIADVQAELTANPAAGPFGCSIYPDRLRYYWAQGEFDRPIYHVEEGEPS